MKLSRRTFLELLGGGALGLGAAELTVEKFTTALNDIERWSIGEEKWSTAFCELCPGGCGLLVRNIDGNIVKLRGNPRHPVNSGGLCPRGEAGLQILYNPDRLRGPLKQNGEKGSGAFVAVSWDEAIADIAGRLTALRNGKPGPQGLLYLAGGPQRSLHHALAARFCETYGTPNYIRYHDQNTDRVALTHYLMHGQREPMAYDLGNAAFILSFGCNFLESWLNPVRMADAYAKMRSGNLGRRGKIVYVDPRFSTTAAKADKWLPIKPGTDGALALGIANVLIQENLVDEHYLKEHTFGYYDWKDEGGNAHQGFRGYVLEHYNIAGVSEITGISVEDILLIGRGFGGNLPAVALGERSGAFQPNDIFTRMAIHALNALVGSFGVPGTMGVQSGVPLSALGSVEIDSTAKHGLQCVRIDGAGQDKWFLAADVIQELPKNIITSTPYAIGAAFIDRANPVFDHPSGDLFRNALTKVPLVISFSSFIDETSSYADYILPDHSFLERWQDDTVSYIGGISVFSVGAPSSPPLYDTRPATETLMSIAQTIGGPLKAAFSWKSYQAVIKDAAKGLYDSGSGYVIADREIEGFRSLLTTQGFHSDQYASYEDFWKDLVARGAWANLDVPFQYSRTNFATPSGKFEFYSQILKRAFDEATVRKAAVSYLPADKAAAKLLAEMGIKANGNELFLPHFEPPGATQSAQFPLLLNTYSLITNASGIGANLPWLEETLAVHVRRKWSNWVELNPLTAKKYGVEEGDRVRVESARGSLILEAILLQGVRPDTVNIPLGHGHKQLGRWAKNSGANPNEIITVEDDLFRGIGCFGRTAVKITKA